MHELRQIIELWNEQKDGSNRLALATLVNTHGPSYRSAGAMALIVDDGACRGSISAGCLEKDIACRLDSGTTDPFLLKYDLSLDDEVRGFPFGCGGDVEIFVQPLAKTSSPAVIEFVQNSLMQASSSVTLLILESPAELYDRFLIKAGDRFDLNKLPALLKDAHAKMSESLERRRSKFVVIDTPYGACKAFVHFLEKPLSITIFGDSEDACILESMASLAGFEVRRHNRKVLRDSSDLTLLVSGEYFVIMTHDLNLDKLVVNAILQKSEELKLKYLGILGPRARSQKIIDLSKSFVFAPVGLDLAAETPGEIALSILSEIQSVAQERANSHLRDKQGAIHERETEYLLGAAILAAGASSRLGSPKQLVEYRGQNLLERAQSALGSIKLSATILGANLEVIKSQCRLNTSIEIIENTSWSEGLSSSIKCAVKYAIQRGCSHLLLMTCDQPAVDSSVIDSLSELSRKNPDSIIACRYGDTSGIPAIFPAKYFEQLLALSGDRGAKKIIESTTDVISLQFEDAALDIDSPQDMSELKLRFRHNTIK